MQNSNEINPAHELKMRLISLSDLSDMHEPTGYSWRLPHRSISRNVLRHLFSCVFDPEMLRFLLLLLLTAKAEASPVGLPARIKQIRCGDDGHEPPRFPSGLV